MRLPIDTDPRLRTTIETEGSQKPEFLGIIDGDPHVKTFDDGQAKIGIVKKSSDVTTVTGTLRIESVPEAEVSDTTPTLYIRSGTKLFKFNLQEVS